MVRKTRRIKETKNLKENEKNIKEDLTDESDIVIEVDDDKSDVFKSKHKIEGKHSLRHDSIFKGKKEEPLLEEEGNENKISIQKDIIEVDKSSWQHQESINNEEYVRNKHIKEKIYQVLKNKTNINFNSNRRKPSKIDFNAYFNTLKKELREESFTNVEIFNELAVYFSDNLFNMFKLLDNKWRNEIIKELQEHIGEQTPSKEVKNRNISKNVEIEFLIEDEDTDDDQEKKVTGVVLESDYENSVYIVDSYEYLYEVPINKITRILNNTKFKYNLSKLDNIDFL